MIRALATILFLFACAASAPAQSGAPPDGPPDLTVVKFSWRHEARLQGWDRLTGSAAVESQGVYQDRIDEALNSNRDPNRLSYPRPPVGRRVEQYVYQAKVRNDGPRKVTAVEWEYVFADPVTQKELARRRFQSLRRIKPGANATLSGTSKFPPSRVVSAGGLAKNSRSPFDERVVIRCVAYSDGAVWKGAGAGSDCERLGKRRK
jgi:hypothetical protein